MSYDISLYRIETKLKEQQLTDNNFFENENNLLAFTNTQHQQLQNRLLRYDYTIIKTDEHGIHFCHEEDQSISVLLTGNAIYFSSTITGIFEISMTASELTDTGEYAKYDPQNGGWEEL